MIAVVDYGTSNVGSVLNMLKKIGAAATVTGDSLVVAQADKIILPGVGSFDTAMQQLRALGLEEVLTKKALEEKVPFLGICLGMQLMTEGSEEGREKGLGWIPAYCRKFESSSRLKVPHMKWNTVHTAAPHLLTEGMGEAPRFYFVHSYYALVSNPEYAWLKTSYGVEFDAGIQRGNMAGVQFHPEKSHRFGLALMKNFVKA